MNTQSTKTGVQIDARKNHLQYSIHDSLGEHQESTMKDQLRQVTDLHKKFRRQDYFMRYFMDRVTARILDQVQVQMSMWAWDTDIQLDVRSTVRDKEKATINIIEWAVKFCEKNKGWVFEKKFNDTSGIFYYRLERKFKWPGSDYRITINGTANVDGCEIKQVRRMRKVWVTDCENGEVK